MLRTLPEFKDAKVVRTRDPLVINKADIVVDVGAIYDPLANRFDHHQRGFEETFGPNYDIKLSSAGLVYQHFGRRVVAQLLNWDLEKPELETVYQKVYDDLIMMFDGVRSTDRLIMELSSTQRMQSPSILTLPAFQVG